MIQETQTKIDRKKWVIIVAAIAIAIVGSTLAINSLSVIDQPQIISDKTFESHPSPPPTPISDYGPKTTSFEQAKITTGLSTISLPSYIPKGLVLDSQRTMADDKRPSSMVTIIYVPEGKQISESDSVEKIVEDGLVILYIKDDYSGFDWEKTAKMMADEAPDVRSIATINGKTILLVKGNPSEGINSQASLIEGNLHINLVARNFDTVELEKVLSSMIAG